MSAPIDFHLSAHGPYPVSLTLDPQHTHQIQLTCGIPGPPGGGGDAGGSALPDPTGAANGQMLAVNDADWVIVPPPSGTGDMQSLIYDPQGKAVNVFDLSNHHGVIDGGIFT
jgi:hypothetical protein